MNHFLAGVLFASTFLITVAQRQPAAALHREARDQLKDEIFPLFQSLFLVKDSGGSCAAEPGPAVCLDKASSVAKKMTEVNSYTSFINYVDDLADASAFFRDCWSCILSDVKTNIRQIKQLCNSLDDVAYALEYTFYETSTPFPVSPELCSELVIMKEGHETFEALGHETFEALNTVHAKTYDFDECKDFFIDLDQDNSRANAQNLCKPEAGTNLKNAVDVGVAALGLLSDASKALPFVGFGVAVFKSIFDLHCQVGEDTGAILDAKKVYSIASEAAKEQILVLIAKEMENIGIDLKGDKAKGVIKVQHALRAASDYMNLANKASGFEIAGFQASVGMLSHSLSLLSLAKHAAHNANENQCVSQIDGYLRNWQEYIGGFRDTAKADVEKLRAEMKVPGNLSHHRKVNTWLCYFGTQPEIEAYSQNRRGIEEVSTRYRWGWIEDFLKRCQKDNYTGRPCPKCLSYSHVVNKAKEMQKHKVDKFVKGKENILFPATTEELFASVKKMYPNPNPTCGNGRVNNGLCGGERDRTWCCSKWGWCGSQSSFCDNPPTRDQLSALAAASANSTSSAEEFSDSARDPA